MITLTSFITNNVEEPFNQTNMLKSYSYGDRDVYNPKINARFHIEDDKWEGLNIYTCNVRLEKNVYRNFMLAPITRNRFYFLAYFPRISAVYNLKNNEIISRIIPKLPTLSKIIDNYGKDGGYKFRNDCVFLEDTLYVEVNANIRELVFAKNNNITSTEIHNAYKRMCNLFEIIEFEINELINAHERVCKDLNAKIAIASKKIEQARVDREKKIKEKADIFLRRKVARMAISAALAGITGGASLLLDAIDSFSDIADIADLTDTADLIEMFDMSEISDIADFSSIDFSFMNIEDIADGIDQVDFEPSSLDNNLGGGMNEISFGSRYSHIDELYDGSIEGAKDNFQYHIQEAANAKTQDWHDYHMKAADHATHRAEFFAQAKDDAIATQKINDAKMNYWNAVSDYTKERLGKKIHG